MVLDNLAKIQDIVVSLESAQAENKVALAQTYQSLKQVNSECAASAVTATHMASLLVDW